MKKSLLVFSMATLLLTGSINFAKAQEQPKPKKDTVNMDTDAKPTFYYAEDDKSKAKGMSTSVKVGLIIGAVVVIGAATFFLQKKKK